MSWKQTIVSFFVMLLTAGIGFSQDTTALSLEQAIRMALQNNPSVLVAQKEMEASSGRILQAEAVPSPEIGISWSEVPSRFRLSEYGDRSVGISQTLEFPGKRGARSRAARLDLQISREKVDQIRLVVAARVKQAYYGAALNQHLIRNCESVHGLWQQFLKTAEFRYQARTAPFLDVLQARVESAKLNNRLIELRQDGESRLSELNRLLGRPGNFPVGLADSLSFTAFTRRVEEVLADLESASPSIKIADARVERDRMLVLLAKKEYLPDFSIGIFSQTLREQPPFDANRFFGTTLHGSWQVDLGMTVPIWFWKKQRGGVIEARSRDQIARIRQAEARRVFAAAIRNAYRAVKTAEALVQNFHDSLLKDTEDQLSHGITLYQTGQMNVFNLLDICRTYYETQSEYWAAVYHYRWSLAELEKAGEDDSLNGANNENQ